MSDASDDRTTKWMVGDQLACVLHIGDSTVAYRLAEQGHEVIVVGDDVSSRRHSDIAYVRSAGDRLPFASSAFDAVVVPHLEDSAVAMAEYARVLQPDGLVSTLTHHHDESIPWLRKLREIIGMRDAAPTTSRALSASGLFHEPEEITGSAWQKFDLDGLMQFARANKHPSVADSDLSRVRDLFDSYANHIGYLQLRHETRSVRARVDKSQLEPEAPAPDPVLLDFN